MEKKKMKLSLKKETVEVLNQNEMSGVYGGKTVTIGCSIGGGCNTRDTCPSLYCSMQAAGCAQTLACGGGGKEMYLTEPPVNERVTHPHLCQTLPEVCGDTIKDPNISWTGVCQVEYYDPTL